MTGSLYYEVLASGRRVALCVDKRDAEDVAAHWYDGQVRELPGFVLVTNTQHLTPSSTYTQTYTLGMQTDGEAKRKEDTQQP